jgi:hypothetical protein
MGGIGFILGGAMQGWGNAQMKVAQDMRDQAFRKEGWAHEEAMAAEDRKFRSQEAEIGREHEDKTQKSQQDFTSGENAKSRDVQGTQYGTNENGETVMIRNGIGTTVTDKATGKPLHATTGKYGDDTSTYVADAKWLVKNGIAPDLPTAYDRVRTSSQNGSERGRMVIDVAKTMATNGEAIPGIDEPTFADYQREAEKFVDHLIESNPDGGGGTGGGGGGGGGGKDVRTQDAEGDVVTPANDIPANPAKRTVGKIYMNQQGKMARWTGNGWEPIRQAPVGK